MDCEQKERVTMYPIGWPCWKLLAKAGVPVSFGLFIHFDSESKTFWAESQDIHGLVVSGEDLQEVQREARLAAETLLELELRTERTLKLRMRQRFVMDDTGESLAVA